MKPFIISYIKSHWVYASYCFAFKAPHYVNRLILLLYSILCGSYAQIVRVRNACAKCVSACMASDLFVCFCPHVCVCGGCSVAAVCAKEVNVQLHSSLSFIDSQYVLLPG